MAQLGNSSPGTTFNIVGSFNQSEGGTYTVPSPGIMVDQLHVNAGANGASSTARCYVWRHSDGVWIVRSNTFTLTTTTTQQNPSGVNSNTAVTGWPAGFIPAGTVIDIGVWVSSANYNWIGGPSGGSRIGTGGDGNYVDHGAAVGPGELAAWIIYHNCLTKIRRSGAWVTWPMQVRRSGIWVVPPVKVRRSGVWVQVQ